MKKLTIEYVVKARNLKGEIFVSNSQININEAIILFDTTRKTLNAIVTMERHIIIDPIITIIKDYTEIAELILMLEN